MCYFVSVLSLVSCDCRLFGAIGKKYKLFLMGNEAKTDGVGIFVAEKWVDSVVRVVYIHFGPWSHRSSVTSVLFLRTELTEDRSD